MTTRVLKEFDTLFENIPFPSWIYEKESMKIVAANNKAQNFFGLGSTVLLSKKITDLRAVPIRTDAKKSPHAKNTADEFQYISAVGEIVKSNNNITTFKFGKKEYCLEILHTSESLENSVTQMRESSEYINSIFENAQIGIYRSTFEGRILTANRALLEILGYTTLDELQSVDVAEGIYAKKSDRIFFLNTLEKSGNIRNYETEWKTKNGEKLYISENAVLVRDGKGAIVCIEGTIENITRHKEYEIELKNSLERFQCLVLATSQIVWHTSPEGEVTGELPSWQAYTGQTFEEIQGKNWASALHPDDVTETLEAWGNAVQNRGSYDVEYRVRRYDGEYRYFHARGVPVLTQDGTIREWVGACTDIEDSRKAKMEKNLLAAIVESSDDAIFSLNFNLEIQSWNKGAEKMFGYTKEDVLGKKSFVFHFNPTTDEESYIRDTLKNHQRLEHMETIWKHKNGSKVHVSISISPILDASGEIIGYSKIARDISSQKAAEKEINELLMKEREARQLAEENQIRMKFLSEAGRLLNESLDYNKTLKVLAGLVTPEISDWCAIELLGEDGNLHRVAVEHYDPEKVKFGFEIEQKYPPDPNLPTSPINILKRGEIVVYPEIPDDLLRLSAQNEEHFDLMKQLGLRSAIIAPLISRGKPLGVITFVGEEPLTEKSILNKEFAAEIAIRAALAIDNSNLYEETLQFNRELEEKVKQRTSQLETVNKELETFSYSVSHDLRAPLRAIDGYAGFLESDFSEVLTEEGRRYISIIKENSNQMGQLIDDLLSFSRMSRAAMNNSSIDIKNLVANIFEEQTRHIKGRSISLECSTLPNCFGDLALLRQVWVNLISNAVKYTRTREKAIVKISGEESDSGVIYKIEDNGVGFDMKYAGKLFGVFQRLHKSTEFEGTGVGLALVQRIIARHGGTISAYGEKNTGAKFSFKIPKEIPI